MSFTERASRNDASLPSQGSTEDRNYYALFDKPTPENLAANRSGVLTAEQKRDITVRIGSHRTSVFFIFGLGVLGVLFLLFLMWMSNREEGTISFVSLLVSGGVITFLLGMFVLVMAGDTFLLFVPNNVADDRVEAVRGKVVWKWNRYQVHSDSRQLRALSRGIALPPPGPYLFYYLPRTGLVVGAEEVGEVSEENSASLLLEVLARANHFSSEDLIKNHEGFLGPNQENRLLAALALYGFIAMSSLLLCGSMASQMFRGHFSNLFLLLLAVGLLLLLRFGWATILLIGDLWNGKVKRVEGKAARESKQYRYVRSYYYVVDDHRFSVLKSAYDALIEGKLYRIYYAPRSRQLVSIEPIQNA